MPNPLKKVKKAVSNVDDGLKRALEVAGLPLEAAAKVAEVAAQGAKDYYNKKPKAGSQPLTDADMARAMDIGTGMAGGTIDWLGGSINAARAAEMAAARRVASPRPTAPKPNPLLEELSSWREEVAIAQDEIRRFLKTNGYTSLDDAADDFPEIVHELRRDYKYAIRQESRLRKQVLGVGRENP